MFFLTYMALYCYGQCHDTIGLSLEEAKAATCLAGAANKKDKALRAKMDLRRRRRLPLGRGSNQTRLGKCFCSAPPYLLIKLLIKPHLLSQKIFWTNAETSYTNTTNH